MNDLRTRFNRYNRSRLLLTLHFEILQVFHSVYSSPQDHRPPFVLLILFVRLFLHNCNLQRCWGKNTVLISTFRRRSEGALWTFLGWVAFSQVLGTLYHLLLRWNIFGHGKWIHGASRTDLGVDTESNPRQRVKLMTLKLQGAFALHLNIKMRTVFVCLFVLYQAVAVKEYKKLRAQGGHLQSLFFSDFIPPSRFSCWEAGWTLRPGNPCQTAKF